MAKLTALLLLAVLATACGVTLRPPREGVTFLVTPVTKKVTPLATLPTENLRRRPLPTTVTLCVSAEVALHVRAAGTVGGHVTGYLRRGDSVPVLGTAPGWIQTRGGWVSAAYVETCKR